ncbi:hypothetical protein TNCV_4365771 [Trichonephila clavipes]|nr:hypothetical protein TNCV_4365771 [Trichonephila clavipes]
MRCKRSRVLSCRQARDERNGRRTTMGNLDVKKESEGDNERTKEAFHKRETNSAWKYLGAHELTRTKEDLAFDKHTKGNLTVNAMKDCVIDDAADHANDDHVCIAHKERRNHRSLHFSKMEAIHLFLTTWITSRTEY